MANYYYFLCLPVLILYFPVNDFSVMSGWVFLGCTSTKQGLMCLALGHKAVMPVRLKPATPRSGVKHSKLRSPFSLLDNPYPLNPNIWPKILLKENPWIRFFLMSKLLKKL